MSPIRLVSTTVFSSRLLVPNKSFALRIGFAWQANPSHLQATSTIFQKKMEIWAGTYIYICILGRATWPRVTADRGPRKSWNPLNTDRANPGIPGPRPPRVTAAAGHVASWLRTPSLQVRNPASSMVGWLAAWLVGWRWLACLLSDRLMAI
jgi:hypothetical protein